MLHHYVFPYWTKRNCREWVRDKYDQPLCQKLDERFAVYFMWKTAALSHTIADFPKLLRLGTSGIIAEIRGGARPRRRRSTRRRRTPCEAMILCLEGLNAYARNLSEQAARGRRRRRATRRARRSWSAWPRSAPRCPEHPCETLDEAVNAIWIGWVGLHMENTNAGLSLGRMDQWLQPYFEADMAEARDPGGARGVHQARDRAGGLLLHALHRPPAPDPRHRQLPLRRQLLRPGHHPGRRDARGRGRGQRHDLHLPQGHRDARHPRPQRQRPLQPGEELRHLPQAPLRGQPHHRGHAVHAQRRGGHGVAGGVRLRRRRTCATGPPPAAWSRPSRASTSATPTA